MSSKIEVEFQFEIGDRVRHKAGGGQVKIDNGIFGKGTSVQPDGIVFSRIAEECSGGIQIMYAVGTGREGFKWHECEMEAFPATCDAESPLPSPEKQA